MISALLVGRRFGFGIPGAEELTTRTAAGAEQIEWPCRHCPHYDGPYMFFRQVREVECRFSHPSAMSGRAKSSMSRQESLVSSRAAWYPRARCLSLSSSAVKPRS